MQNFILNVATGFVVGYMLTAFCFILGLMFAGLHHHLGI